MFALIEVEYVDYYDDEIELSPVGIFSTEELAMEYGILSSLRWYSVVEIPDYVIAVDKFYSVEYYGKRQTFVNKDDAEAFVASRKAPSRYKIVEYKA